MAKSNKSKETPVISAGVEVVEVLDVADVKLVEETPNANVAIVSVNGREARKFTLKLHGSDFAKLAEEFADHTKGAEVKLVRLEKGVVCPACGNEFHP